MKRALVFVMIVGLVVGSVATAEAGKGKKGKKGKKVQRTAESAYEAPAFGSPSSGGVCLHQTNSCARTSTGNVDKFVKVSVADATSTAVAFTLGQDTDEATVSTEVTYGVFCGTTGDAAIRLEAPGVELLTFVWAFGDIRCPGGIATTGTVTATFSNLP